MTSNTRAVDTGTEKMLAHVADGIGWMTYNNPARLNAMSYDMQIAVPRILGVFTADPDVHVIVVQGAGDRVFVSGADISEFSEKRTTVAARADYDDALAAAWGSWRTVEKPIIAMIRGYCIGGGLLTAMKADIRIASDDSQFGVPAAKLGLGYAYGGVEELMSLVGPSWTAEILFSARRLSAAEAQHIGLVNRVVAVADLEATVRDLAAAIAANAPLTVQACKAAIREARRDPADRDLDAVEQLVEACFRSEDYLEGQAAFAEKRPPQFTGEVVPTRAERALTRVRKICEALPDAEERPSHGAPTFFYKGKKSFLMFHDDHHGDGRLAIWCAAPVGVQDQVVREEPTRFFVPAYVGYRGWIGLRLDVDVDWSEVAGVVHDAYCMVAPKTVVAALTRPLTRPR